RVANQFREFLHAAPGKTRLFLQCAPVKLLDSSFQFLEAESVLANEDLILPTIGKHDLQRTRYKRDVATLRNRKPVIGNVGAKQRAPGCGWHPITLHSWLEIRIHQDDLRPELLRLVQIFCRDRLVIGRVSAEENDEVSAKPV